MTQKEQVRTHILKAGSISSFEAIMDYGITRLAARINDLKNEGHKIKANRKKNELTKRFYVRYSFELEP
jgi:uncharacterized small protein (DUF1192 family)